MQAFTRTQIVFRTIAVTPNKLKLDGQPAHIHREGTADAIIVNSPENVVKTLIEFGYITVDEFVLLPHMIVTIKGI